MHKQLTQQELQELALRLNSVIETAIDSIITIDSRGVIESINPAVTKLFGYSKEELIGQNVSILMPSPDREQHDRYIGNYIGSRQPKIIGIGREVVARKKNGVLFPIRLAVSEFKLNDKTTFTGIIHDLTEVKQAEERIKKLNEELEQKVNTRTEELARTINKLLKSNKQLEHEIIERKAVEAALRKSERDLTKAFEKEKELNAMKTRFVSLASHEFRTPLSTILSSADLVEAYKEEVHQTNRLKHTHRIKAAVNNLNTILNDFLSLSRLDEKKVEAKPVMFSFSEFKEEIIDQIQGFLKQGQRLVHTNELETELLCLDKQLLKNILLNLLTNAIKYSDENKSIYCRSYLENDDLVIEVKDEGIGIPKEEQKHLFTRFFRAKNVENIKGTGLGLNIVRNYVELMDGKINFTSEEGKGSTFIITIPLAE
ncbi:MAG: PAS domain-containing sensor histidine kinase [Saprospiraceae bacterium]|nr:PAS domain-containing sensor histidine kinase [Saprospiraceae bacterium]MCB9324882.1 PAS domain-containing sensor histidine kinase [Lewinellaceae bacterium]